MKKKETVIFDVQFVKCPNKDHKAETAIIVGGGSLDGFVRFGCSCAAELMLQTLKYMEKPKRKKREAAKG